MSFTVEAFARDLVLTLYCAADGQEHWWPLPACMKALEREALDLAVARGWLVSDGRYVCLSSAGLDICSRDVTGR
jgi:hypothetical protein